MKVAVLGESPAFPLNMSYAFGLRYETRLFSATPSDYRQQYAGTILDTEKNQQEAREFVENAGIIFVAGVASLKCLSLIGGDNWMNWVNSLNGRLVLFIVDTPYWFDPTYYNGLIEILNPKLFIMPDMVHLAHRPSVPLFYPHKINKADKLEKPTVLFTPGNKKKSETKGTELIESAIKQLIGENLYFSYHRLMYTRYSETLRAKAAAHILIDRIPPTGEPNGMGNTGLEGLAAGMAVVTDMYNQNLTDDYFPRPPVIDVKDKAALCDALKLLIVDKKWRDEVGAAGQEWIKENFEFEPWLNYVEKYL